MKEYNIHRIPTDGYLVIPLSMSRLSEGKRQSPEECFKIIQYFEKKVSRIGIDFIFLYTNGLYYNNSESALKVRKKTNSQMIEHKNKLLNLLVKSKRYIPQCAHFIPWDYVILNSPKYQECYQKLIDLTKKDKLFKGLLKTGLVKRKITEANMRFLIEEIAVTHLIRQKLIEFPKTLVKEDRFRLVIYPGTYFKADLYQYKKGILHKNKDLTNPYCAAHYDFSKKILYDFNKMEL